MIYWRQIGKPRSISENKPLPKVKEITRDTGRLGCECHYHSYMSVYREVEKILTIKSEIRRFTVPECISTIQCLSPDDPKATAYDLLISHECQWVALNWVVGEGIKEATHNILWWAVQQKDAYWNADLKKYFPNWYAGFHPGVIGSSEADSNGPDLATASHLAPGVFTWRRASAVELKRIVDEWRVALEETLGCEHDEAKHDPAWARSMVRGLEEQHGKIVGELKAEVAKWKDLETGNAGEENAVPETGR